jgi:hypothetical protein
MDDPLKPTPEPGPPFHNPSRMPGPDWFTDPNAKCWCGERHGIGNVSAVDRQRTSDLLPSNAVKEPEEQGIASGLFDDRDFNPWRK